LNNALFFLYYVYRQEDLEQLLRSGKIAKKSEGGVRFC